MSETPEQFQTRLRTWNKNSLVGSIRSLEARLRAVWKDPGYGDIPPQAIADALSTLDNLRIAITGTFKCNGGSGSLPTHTPTP